MESLRKLQRQEAFQKNGLRKKERDREDLLGIRYKRGTIIYDRVTGQRGVIEASARGTISKTRST